MHVKTILLVCLVAFTNLLTANSDIWLRLNPKFYDEHSQTVYVDVELRYLGQGNFTLADQNYRLYFDSELLSLNAKESHSDLPQDLYSDIQFMELLEELRADEINQLAFDDNLGFVNFNIDLNNLEEGGLPINRADSWQRVAVLNFKVKDPKELSEIVWSHSGSTDNYATAFVEIMEWVAPNQTEPVEIEEFIDAAFTSDEEANAMSVTLAPNPTVDFVKLSFEENLTNNMKVSVKNNIGQEVKQTMAYRGAQSLNLMVADLPSGTYTVEIMDANTKQVAHTTKLVKINR